MKTTVSEKGQITIPKRLRESLGIGPGEVLECREERGRFVATKVRRRDPVDAAYGILDLEEPTDAAITKIRGKADTV